MIIPTRFGLKYAPIPTLALEYEDDLKGVVDATGEKPTSLYVYRDEKGSPPPGPTRKLHVVELPMLKRTSEIEQITRQLQQDNGRFLAPGVVSETQLKRLLDRLVQNLPDAVATETNDVEVRQPALATAEVAQQEKEDAGSELGESMMEGSVMEESIVEASKEDDHEKMQPSTTSEANPNRGAFLPQDGGNREDESEDEVDKGEEAATTKLAGQDELEASHGDESDHDENPPENAAEAEEDAKKKRALLSESDVSEEEVHSEELEYFSEDGSDEDSF